MFEALSPQIVQVVPFEDYTVDVYFDDGKIVCYDVKPHINEGIFKKLKDLDFFLERCTILNDTLAWDVTGNRDEFNCIDIDPEMLYSLEAKEERISDVG